MGEGDSGMQGMHRCCRWEDVVVTGGPLCGWGGSVWALRVGPLETKQKDLDLMEKEVRGALKGI